MNCDKAFRIFRILPAISLATLLMIPLSGCLSTKQPGTAAGAQTQTEESCDPNVIMPPEEIPITPVRPVAHAGTEYEKEPSYTVKSGDSLSKIASMYGVTANEICRLNSIPNPNRLMVGQVLDLPANASRKTAAKKPGSLTRSGGPKSSRSSKITAAGTDGLYTIQPGDTLSEIAATHKTTAEKIKQANNMTDDRLIAGRKIRIPEALQTAVPAPTASETSAKLTDSSAETARAGR